MSPNKIKMIENDESLTTLTTLFTHLSINHSCLASLSKQQQQQQQQQSAFLPSYNLPPHAAVKTGLARWRGIPHPAAVNEARP